MRRRDIGVGPGILAAAAAAAALLAAVAGCSAGAGADVAKRPAAGASVSTRPVSATGKASPAARRSASPTATPAPRKPSPAALPVGPADAGKLAQTGALPKTAGTAFGNAVHDLWLALSSGNPGYARPAFFPEQAYVQVKAIADPQADWQGRLWYDFTLDVAAAHKLIKPGATLSRVITPTQYEQWIPAGACYNSTGYWHLPGSRLVYRQDGVTHSFGLASFISWRGTWYLIHLGALVRGGAYGIVDDPETGQGIPGPAGGC